MHADAPALVMTSITVERSGHRLLHDVFLTVWPGQRWVVLGPNGGGKTTLLRIAALYDHPTTGVVEVLGQRLGRVDVRELRRRIGYLSPALADQLRPTLRALDVVRTARFAALEPWWHRYTADDDQRAVECLGRMGVERFAEREFGSLSSGERQRVLIARTLMTDPAVVLLDEPAARLDLGGRERLIVALDALAADATSPPSVIVTHHVDEIPPSTTHALLLRAGGVVATGLIGDVLDGPTISACFDLPLELVRRRDGRYMAWLST